MDGRARYVTAVAATDVVDGWRDRRRDGGCVIDVKTSEVIATGLSMPHPPRWHRGRLWLLDSGTGRLGSLAPGGAFEPLAFRPGYLRGLAFAGDYAVVGLPEPRHEKTFGWLAVGEELAAKGVAPWCGLCVIGTRSGDVVEWVRLGGGTRTVRRGRTAGVVRPMAFGRWRSASSPTRSSASSRWATALRRKRRAGVAQPATGTLRAIEPLQFVEDSTPGRTDVE